MKSRRILSIIGLILAAVLLLGIGFAIGRNEVQASVPDATDAVRSQDGAPPKELWYLGGATIFQRQEGLRNQTVYRQPLLSMFP